MPRAQWGPHGKQKKREMDGVLSSLGNMPSCVVLSTDHRCVQGLQGQMGSQVHEGKGEPLGPRRRGRLRKVLTAEMK